MKTSREGDHATGLHGSSLSRQQGALAACGRPLVPCTSTIQFTFNKPFRYDTILPVYAIRSPGNEDKSLHNHWHYVSITSSVLFLGAHRIVWSGNKRPEFTVGNSALSIVSVKVHAAFYQPYFDQPY